MRLIVGLGNPGQRYRDTPHNAGFLACDCLARRNHLGPEVRKFQGLFCRGRIGGEDVGILKPETYMNLSGRCVAEALRYLPVEPSDLIVVLDDMDVVAGKLRLRKGGGHAGHNGLRSIIDHLGTGSFPRVRIGIGRPRGVVGATAHVLSRPPEEERRRLERTVTLAAEAVEVIIARGIDAAMNQFNGLPPVGGDEEGREEGEG